MEVQFVYRVAGISKSQRFRPTSGLVDTSRENDHQILRNMQVSYIFDSIPNNKKAFEEEVWNKYHLEGLFLIGFPDVSVNFNSFCNIVAYELIEEYKNWYEENPQQAAINFSSEQ